MRFCVLLLSLFISLPVGWAAPRVVVSIKPIHSLVFGVMKGVGEPELLMAGNESPHHHSLSPSEMRTLSSADIIIWVGPDFETRLKKPIHSAKITHVLTLTSAPGVKLLAPRSGGLWVSHSHHHHHQEHHHESISPDGHIWLSPNNAKAITQAVAKTLATRDPEHAARYMANSEEVIKKLDKLDEAIKKMIAPVRHSPYLVLHDSTQYFDDHYGTLALGSLIEEPGQEPRPAHIRAIVAALKEKKVRTLFSEPQVNSPWIQRLCEDYQMRLGTLDYIGVDLKAGEGAYFTMMMDVAQEMVRALGGRKSGSGIGTQGPGKNT